MLGQLHRPLTAGLALILGCALCTGCSSSRQTEVQEPSDKTPRKELAAPLAKYEATLNPADYDDDVEIVKKAQATEQAPPPLELLQDSTVVQEDMTQGFRIQIFSSSSIDEATQARTNALVQFPSDSIYIVYDPPVYKVRVGDFITRYEADQRMPAFVEKGYKDAWIVPDRIVRRRRVLVPPGEPGAGGNK